ncbi:uncharacterized protein EV154DRAFT_540982 [Mucor mucedo]|uniref:uncharacterized protein n=1 Tax=Mucor mucedo TaxID=29922 RepID=UPI00221FEBC3|nr:uncharacterized protein EV154DRAFT_540982 [Mucor mucedo]KAI7866911.1 hypothetical protein EV154DRAFT_540982 [Mucor mucedo]
MNGNVGLVKFALDHGAAIDSVVNGYMPLQLACISENHIAVVQYLIDRGADVNAQRWSKKHVVDKSQAVAGATGSTALHVACANGCTKIVDLLLRNGAKIHVKDKYGSRPIDVAAAKHHVEIVKLLDTFASMQQMLKGLQEGSTKQHRITEEIGRRSMDASLYTQQQQLRADRLRRPSLPSVFESQKLDIPDISTLPPLPARHSLNTPRPCPDELLNLSKPRRYQHYFQPSPPEDWYSYGVVNHYEDENYLTSLERRAFGMTSPTHTPSAYFNDGDETAKPVRASLDHRRPSLDSTPLKRCSSDGGHLRTTALKNAMAANNISLQDDEFGNIIPLDEELEDEELDETEEEEPRPSLYDERPDLEALEKVKKSWFATGRKSVDVYPTGRPSLENRRSSMDFRPSFDGLSQLAKKSMEGLSRKSIDVDYVPEDGTTKKSRGFLAKWWSTSTTSNNVK